MQSYFFPETYKQAHQSFCRAIDRAGWRLDTKTYSSVGLEGEPLATAVAIHQRRTQAGTGQDESTPTLVISIGLHGVEGFLGTAVVLDLLKRYEQDGVPDCNVVLMHALNPYGYSYHRRCDAFNRDLNRNFLIENESYSGASSLYRRLDSILNPRRPPSRCEPFAAKAAAMVLRHGFRKVQSAIAEGQYEYPQGLFYGGDRPSELGEWLSGRFSNWLGDSQRVIHLDFHTGLGRRADYKLMIETELNQAQWLDWQNHFNSQHLLRLKPPRSGLSTEAESDGQTKKREQPYQARGTLGGWCQRLLSVEKYTFAVAEFGTLHPFHVLAALRAENQCHHWGGKSVLSASTEDKKSAAEHWAKRRLLEAFCPSSKQWRKACVDQASGVIENVTRMLIKET